MTTVDTSLKLICLKAGGAAFSRKWAREWEKEKTFPVQSAQSVLEPE